MEKAKIDDTDIDAKISSIRDIHKVGQNLSVRFEHKANILGGSCFAAVLQGDGYNVPEDVSKYIVDILNQALEPVLQDLRFGLKERAILELTELLAMLRVQADKKK